VYAAALQRLEEIRLAWEAEGKPLIALGSTGQQVESPLVRLLRESEAHVARLGEIMRRRSVGRPLSPDRAAYLGPPPAVVKLRGVREPRQPTGRPPKPCLEGCRPPPPPPPPDG
jgi:hypothetical protein